MKIERWSVQREKVNPQDPPLAALRITRNPKITIKMHLASDFSDSIHPNGTYN